MLIRRIRDWVAAENGFSTAAIFIIAMPVMIGVFGLAFDTARATAIHKTLQAEADLAVQGATSIGYTDAKDSRFYLGTQTRGTGVAITAATNIYTHNTAVRRAASPNYSWLLPVDGSNGTPIVKISGTPPTRAQLCALPGVNPYEVTLTVHETIPTTFTRILQIEGFPIDITSVGIVRGRNC